MKFIICFAFLNIVSSLAEDHFESLEMFKRMEGRIPERSRSRSHGKDTKSAKEKEIWYGPGKAQWAELENISIKLDSIIENNPKDFSLMELSKVVENLATVSRYYVLFNVSEHHKNKLIQKEKEVDEKVKELLQNKINLWSLVFAKFNTLTDNNYVNFSKIVYEYFKQIRFDRYDYRGTATFDKLINYTGVKDIQKIFKDQSEKFRDYFEKKLFDLTGVNFADLNKYGAPKVAEDILKSEEITEKVIKIKKFLKIYSKKESKAILNLYRLEQLYEEIAKIQAEIIKYDGKLSLWSPVFEKFNTVDDDNFDEFWQRINEFKKTVLDADRLVGEFKNVKEMFQNQKVKLNDYFNEKYGGLLGPYFSSPPSEIFRKLGGPKKFTEQFDLIIQLVEKNLAAIKWYRPELVNESKIIIDQKICSICLGVDDDIDWTIPKSCLHIFHKIW